MIGERQLISGEMHYPRIPREYWPHRMAMARAMGLNAISTYVFWNVHEEREGIFSFQGGSNVAEFIRLAHEHGLSVLLRPGPYVCAEWDYGGLPSWLAAREVAVRTNCAAFLDPVRAWFARLGEEVGGLCAPGGPVAAVQLENEYGAFGSDESYLSALRDILVNSGLGSPPMYTIDQPGDLERGSLDGVAAAVTFAPGDAGKQFAQLRQLRPGQRLLCAEYWAGWFDHWGEARAQLDDGAQLRDLQWMLENGVSVNIYMLHGGTNHSLWNGANAFAPRAFQPTVTSYDYQAAIDEGGRPRSKYFAFRDAIVRHTGIAAPQPPPAPPQLQIAPFTLDCIVPLGAALGISQKTRMPLSMEALGHSRGFLLYRTILRDACRGVLHIDARDYAVVMVDGRVAGTLDRRIGTCELDVRCSRGAVLDVLVENCGRINYGPSFALERKGIGGEVTLSGAALEEWEVFAISPDLPALSGVCKGPGEAPAFYQGAFIAQESGDTYLDTSELGKGVLWVNGRCAGRYWNAGPQQALFIPGPWITPGENIVVAFELLQLPGTPRLQGGTEQLWRMPTPTR